MVNIIDINGKLRNILSLKKIIHQVVDMNGNFIDADYVEIVIKGKTRTWIEWYPLEEFKDKNPNFLF